MCIGFNRVLDAGINSERSITIIIGVRRFDEPFPLAGLTGSGIHTGSTTWPMSVGWSTVHTETPMTSPGSVSPKDSINIMAFLLQKNGVPGGTVPLDDTVDLSKVLPVK